MRRFAVVKEKIEATLDMAVVVKMFGILKYRIGCHRRLNDDRVMIKQSKY